LCIRTGVFTVRDMGIEDNLCSFVKGFSDDLNSLELLMFFSRHPKARFNRTAVLHASVSRRFDAGLALKRLIDQQVVVAYVENGLTLYSLTKEEPAHSLAIEMVTIDQQRWQVLLGFILDAQEIQEIQ
jgi:hypothetical protein